MLSFPSLTKVMDIYVYKTSCLAPTLRSTDTFLMVLWSLEEERSTEACWCWQVWLPGQLML